MLPPRSICEPATADSEKAINAGRSPVIVDPQTMAIFLRRWKSRVRSQKHFEAVTTDEAVKTAGFPVIRRCFRSWKRAVSDYLGMA